MNPEDIKAELKRIGDEVKAAGEKALTEAKNAGTLSTETKAEVDGLLLKQGELQASLQHTQQALAKIEASARAATCNTYRSAGSSSTPTISRRSLARRRREAASI